jgi:hypothetical protein
VSELQGLMESDSSFTLPVLDTLSNLSLEESLMVKRLHYYSFIYLRILFELLQFVV